ncbi:MAG: GNAT family N-acetyltransferase [Pseudomonadota bacterium]
MTPDFRIPELTTDRLRLRLPRMDDFDAYARYRASERSRHVGGPNSRADAFSMLSSIIGQWQLRGYGRWIVADKTSDAPLGVVGIYHPDDWPEAEIGWTVFEEAEGKGIAYEAALATRRYAYDTLGWSTIISLVAPENTRSAALARRMGCRQDGVFSHDTYGDMPIWRHPAPSEVSE